MNGILLIDKEQDWTSNDVVAKLKGILHERRIGHSGTLDPMATGLLVVFIGRATRAVEFAEGHDKRYLASLRLGVTTDTQDTTGNVLKTGDASGVDEAALRAVLDRFTGEQLQTPPMYSAIKVNGRRLYDIARSGGEVERAPRPICVKSIEITGRDGDDWPLDISCSKGTYVRTLCNDIGDALGLHLGFHRHDGCSVIGSLLLDPFQGQIDQHPQDDNGDEDKKSGQQSLDGFFHSRSLLFFSQDWL